MLKTILISFVVALALLSFPSVLPGMIAFWLVWHTWLVLKHRAGWLPLLACLGILLLKRVPMTPMMWVFSAALILAIVIRFRRQLTPSPAVSIADNNPRHRGDFAVVGMLWISWGLMFHQWHQSTICNRAFTLKPDRPIVCIGDSLTQGLLPDRGYPEQLRHLVRLPVINLGYSGITAAQGSTLVDRVLEKDPQIVVVELGGHDFLKGHGRASTKKALNEIITRCRAGDAEVILMEIPRGFIFDPFSGLEREIGYQRDVQVVADTWLRQIVLFSPIAPPGKWMPSHQLSDDGIHSNQAGSLAIAQKVATALAQLCGSSILTEPATAIAERHHTEQTEQD